MPPSTEGATERRAGRPRSAEVDRAILEATLELIAEDGLDALAIEAVATRAGVGKATLYRRWPHKEALVVDALASLHQDGGRELPGRSVREDLVLILDRIRTHSRDSMSERLFPKILGAGRRHPEVIRAYRERILDARTAELHALLHRGIATGELRADLDVELASTAIVAPMLHLAMLGTDRPLGEDTAERLVDLLLAGLERAPDGR